RLGCGFERGGPRLNLGALGILGSRHGRSLAVGAFPLLERVVAFGDAFVEILDRLAIGLLGLLDLGAVGFVLLAQAIALLLGRRQLGLKRGALIFERARLRGRGAQRFTQTIAFLIGPRGGRRRERR